MVNCDRTYRTVIKRIDKNGYVITDQAGQERIVPCGIPNMELRPGQSVYVKEPMGKISELHICNLAGNTAIQAEEVEEGNCLSNIKSVTDN